MIDEIQYRKNTSFYAPVLLRIIELNFQGSHFTWKTLKNHGAPGKSCDFDRNSGNML